MRAPRPIPLPTPNLNPAPDRHADADQRRAYIIKSSTSINTSQAAPTITTDGVTDAGMFFKNVATNGSPSRFLFGTNSLFDNRMNFDNQFAADFSNAGVYSFSSLQIEGNPTFITRQGADKIALISATDITSSPLGGTVNLNGLDSLFLGTASGSISLERPLQLHQGRRRRLQVHLALRP